MQGSGKLPVPAGCENAESGSRFEWNIQMDSCSLAKRFKAENEIFTVEFREPGTRVGESDSCVSVQGAGRRPTVIRYHDQQPAILAPGRYLDSAAGGLLSDAVADGVLDQRLQDHIGNFGLQSIRRDVLSTRSLSSNRVFSI